MNKENLPNKTNGLIPATQRKLPPVVAPKILGVTSVISMAEPTARDIQKTNELQATLISQNIFETVAEAEHRLQILAKLNALVKQWVRDVSVSRKMSPEAADKLGGKIYIFGSFRLGVHNKGADIDALCVAPRNITRADYFKSFFALLQKQRGVTQVRAIAEARVPLIKMNFQGIEIDLVFARLAFKKIPENLDLRNDMLLRNLDPKCVRSLSGFRLTEEMLSLVPNPDSFRWALRTVKLWAKRHGIYSNMLGYFGGVSWAILVARTCQLYPNAAPATLVHKFFLICTSWVWPRPILLKYPKAVNLGFPVWDPRVNSSDQLHLMPIITPAYPHQNSTFNVTESTKKVIMSEMNNGMAIMNDIMMGKGKWDRLFEESAFFYRYSHFLVLLVSSPTPANHLEWNGLVESKIRLLVRILDRKPTISLAHINPKCFKRHNEAESSTTTPFCSLWFLGLEFQCIKNSNVDFTEEIRNFTSQVYSYATNIKMFKVGMQIEARYIEQKDLHQYLEPNILKQDRHRMANSNSILTSKKRKNSFELAVAETKSARHTN